MLTSVGVISWRDGSSNFRKIRVCNPEEGTEVQRQELGRLWGRIEGQAEARRVGGTGGVAVRTTVRTTVRRCWVKQPQARSSARGLGLRYTQFLCCCHLRDKNRDDNNIYS